MLTIRPRRLRSSPLSRELVSETQFDKKSLIYPLFLVPGIQLKSPIASLEGQNHYSIDRLMVDLESWIKLGLNKFILFSSGEQKFEDARSAYHPKSIISMGVQEIKKQFGKDIYLITDICTCAFTTHGHCGIVVNKEIDNDLTLEVLAKIALSHAQAGVDMVAPSDMMDGRIGYIRKALDEQNFKQIGIMAYATKYASSYYGPFREAADSSPVFGDRKTYQMDFRNPKESIREASLDEAEGADILMVKPALAYLDIIYRISLQTQIPLACYNVSGEYALVKSTASHGLIDERSLVMENMIAFRRAGANMILSYHARDIFEKQWI